MTTLQINSICPIINECCGNKYEGIAFDRCYFYMTVSDICEIDKFDSCFCKIDSIKTCRKYTSICYDTELKCFWAISNSDCSYIYKLDKNLKEIDYICIGSLDDCPARITSVSCSCNRGKLLIGTTNLIAEISKCNCPTICILKKYPDTVELKSMHGMYNSYITAYYKCKSTVISVYSYDNNSLIKCYLSDEYRIKDFVVLDACSKLHYKEIYILVSKHCSYPYILKCILMQNHDKEDICCLNKQDAGFIECVTDCNLCCEPECCTKSANSIIESIALIETAISHILNAEGEKIQKILESTNDVCEIITVNETVNNVIMNVTHLEHVLYSKLQIARSMLPEHCKEQVKRKCSKDCKNECKKSPSKTCKSACKKNPPESCKDKKSCPDT